MQDLRTLLLVSKLTKFFKQKKIEEDNFKVSQVSVQLEFIIYSKVP